MLRKYVKKIPFAIGAYELFLKFLRLIRRIVAGGGFFVDFFKFKRKSKVGSKRFPVRIKNLYPCISDKVVTTDFDRHYVYHTAWAARVVAKIRPTLHVDISSSIYFSTLVSAFIPIEFYDYRPAILDLSHLQSKQGDLLALPFKDHSIESLSCMHVVEHIGLGRYGDTLDPEGDITAISELKRVLAVGGSLLFVVPIGKPTLMFNAHRIYSYEMIMGFFSDLSLEEFALIPNDPRDGGLIYDATKEMADKQIYGCGCFWFRRV